MPDGPRATHTADLGDTQRPYASPWKGCEPGSRQRGSESFCSATSGTVVATVSGIVRTTVVAPDRNDYHGCPARNQAARPGGARGCALCLGLHAVHADPGFRDSSAVLRPGQAPIGRLPAGTAEAAAASRSSSRRRGSALDKRRRAVPSPGQLAVPSFEDLADLVVRRCYEGLQSGRPTVSLQDAAAVMRLAWQIERDEAIPERDAALRQLAGAQAAVLTLKDAIIRRSGLDEWRALWSEVQKDTGEDTGDPEGEAAFRDGAANTSSQRRA